MADPTPGEVHRGLTDVTRRLELLAERMERTYVTREVYLLGHDDHTRRIKDLEDDNEAKAQFAADTRRQLLVGILIALTTALIALIVAVYFGSGGP